MRHLAGILGRLLELVQRHEKDAAVLLGRLDLNGIGHLTAPWAWVSAQRSAALKPCPSARPGVQTEGRLRGEPAARSEAEEAGRKTIRRAPGAEHQAAEPLAAPQQRTPAENGRAPGRERGCRDG